MILKKTNHNPCIYFAHSEAEYKDGVESISPGLSAGFLSTKKLTEKQKVVWQTIFENDWENTCYLFANQLSRLGVDSFAIVPCSRIKVVNGIRYGFLKSGMTEISNLIRKAGNEVSYAKKDSLYISENTFINYELIHSAKISKIAICDDFSDTGKTLWGLHEMIKKDKQSDYFDIFLCSIGVSNILTNGK